MVVAILMATVLIGAGTAMIVHRPLKDEQTAASELNGPALPASLTATLPETVRGIKVLIAFDVGSPSDDESAIRHRTADVDAALKKAGCRIIERVNRSLCLIDGLKHPPSANLQLLPHRQGALVFEDGQLRESLPFENKHHRGHFLQAEPFACLHWAPGPHHQEAMEHDVARFSRMPGVVVEKVKSQGIGNGAGNSWILKLTPAEGKTLLEVFQETRAGFHYKEIQP
jgi:hypothetical protein